MTDDTTEGGPIEETNVVSIDVARMKKRTKAAQKDDAGFLRGAEGGIIKTHPDNVRLAINKLGVTLRYNEFNRGLEIDGLPSFGPELNDPAAIRLRFAIQEEFGFYPSKDLFDETLTDLAHVNRYHPVRDYLDGLSWDGTKRIDRWLIEYAEAEDNDFNCAVGRLWLIAGVRRIRNPGAKFDTLLTLESSQGKNKSSAAAILAKKQEWFSDSISIGADPKETIEQLSGSWITEIAELKGIRKNEIERIKAFLSRQVDKARPAFGKLVETVPRQSIFFGSTNDSEYLVDEENRRFWPVKIKEFDLTKLRADVDQLWAEAAEEERSGVPITLPESLWTTAAEVQAERRLDNPFAEQLRKAIPDGPGWVTSIDLWEKLAIPIDRRYAHQVRVGQAMTALGFKNKRWKGAAEPEGRKRDDRYFERGEGGPRLLVTPLPILHDENGKQTTASLEDKGTF